MKKRLSAILLAAMLLLTFSVFSLSVFAQEEVTGVVWNYGYVGSSVKSTSKNQIVSSTVSTDPYRYTDVIEIPKAGTKITFTDVSTSGDTGSYYVSNNAYVFSTWEKVNDVWVIDLDCPCIMGTYQYDYIGQKNVTGGMEYTYITDRDNVGLRVCYRNSANEENPKIYTEATTDPSTRAQYEAQTSATIFNSTSGKIEGITWNSGYVGSSTNTNGSANEAKYISAGYLFSNIITVPKKGTEISFTYTATNTPNNAYYAVSIWEKVDNHYICSAGFNGIDTAVMTGSGTHIFKYITSVDNENIRLCYRSDFAIASSYTNTPDIYFNETDQQGTYMSLYPEYYLDAETLSVVWNNNTAVASQTSLLGFHDSIGTYSGYATTDVITVDKAGTKIFFTDTISDYANQSVYTISSWKKVSNEWVIDLDGAKYIGAKGKYVSLIESSANGGVTYSYTTSVDNENIRLCYNSGSSTTHPTVSVLYNATYTGTYQTTCDNAWEAAPLPTSLETGAPVYATEISNVVWYNGYVGSQYHISNYNVLTFGNIDYMITDVMTIAKAGTKVYFFDEYFTDFDAGLFASTSVMSISHWKSVNNAWVIDVDKDNQNGCEVPSYFVNSKYKIYCYTTTEDNENIRVSYRGGERDATTPANLSKIYIEEPINFNIVTQTGSCVATSYVDGGGNTINYSIFLPNNYSNDAKDYSLVFNLTDESRTDSLETSSNNNTIVVNFSGSLDDAYRLLDEIIENYEINAARIFLICGDDFVSIVDNKPCLFAAVVVDAAEKPEFERAASSLYSSFTNNEEAINWLVSNAKSYYSILENITMYAIGDSYFGGSDIGRFHTWPSLLGAKYDMTFKNFGIGGNTIGSYTGDAAANQPAMVNRFGEMPDGGDIYFIEGGRNDRRYNVPFGDNDSLDGTTFKGALNIMLNSLREKNPDALIILVTAWNYIDPSSEGLMGTNVDYANAMRELVEYRNDNHIVCLYAADVELSGVEMQSAEFRAEYCLSSSDVSHLNIEGMYNVFDKFEPVIAGYYTDFLDSEGRLPVETTIKDEETEVPSLDTTVAQTTEMVDNSGCNCSSSSAFISMLVIFIGGVVFIFNKKKI